MGKRIIIILMGIGIVIVLGILAMPYVKELLGLDTNEVQIAAEAGENQYYRETVRLEWKPMKQTTMYSVTLATDKEFTDKIIYETEECFVELDNLLMGTDYYWTVTGKDKTTTVKCFHTAHTARTIMIDGVSNTRDCGGFKTEDGKTVKLGMIYRGAKLENITEKGKQTMLEQLCVRTDLDLRDKAEIKGLNSVLGDGIQYLNYSGPYYWGDNGIAVKEYREAILGEIRTFANADNYPVYVHCSLGRDRTGTICFLINALLGVDEQDLYLDYKLSFLSEAGMVDDPNIDNMISQYQHMYNRVKKYAPDGTMAEATEEFMLRIGVTQEEIATIRRLLLE